MKQVVVFVIGIPDSGKTEVMDYLSGKLEEQESLEVGAVNDYRFFKEWKADPENQHLWEPVGEDGFDLFPEAYRSISHYAAERIRDKTLRHLEQGKHVVLIEAARGAYGIDNYREGLALPLMTSLDGDLSEVELCGIEVVVSSKDELVRRAKERLDGDPEAPPVEVPLKYFNGDKPYSSISQLRSLGIKHIWILPNEGDMRDLERELDRKLPLIVDLLEGKERGIEGSFSGGLERF